jgi:hypothetical protein
MADARDTREAAGTGVASEHMTPLQRAEAEVRAIKERDHTMAIVPVDDLGLGPDWTVIGSTDIGKWQDWNEPQRLAVLTDMVNWEGVEAADKRRILEREVDFSRVAPQDQWVVLDGEVWHENDTKPFGRHGEDAAEQFRSEGHQHQTPPGAQDRPIRPLTQQLIDCCFLDVWPGRAAVVDFGLDTDRHLGALQFAIREELVTPQELDAAMGNGPKLTEIAQRGRNPYGDVAFRTAWDDMPREPDADRPMPEGPATHGDSGRAAMEPPAHGEYQVWDDNPGVRSYTPKPFAPRDTDAGDVVVDPQGKHHRYDGRGFSEIKAAGADRLPSPSDIAQGRGADGPEQANGLEQGGLPAGDRSRGR